ncbi:MAG: hypothetical protein AAGB05_17675 [Pseudomonadota bacterium]
MRRILPGDIAAVARVLYRLPQTDRAGCLERLLTDAETADAYRQRTGRAHPRAGTGSLMSAASPLARATEPDFGDARYCRCWIMVLEALLARSSGATERGAVTEARIGGISSRL